MKISITKVTGVMKQALQAKGYSEEDIPFLIEMYLGGELRGHTSHGLASFPSFISQNFSDLATPEVIKETSALFMLDAKSNSGTIVGKRAADEAIARAKKEVAGIAVIKNMDSWLRPGAIAEYIAKQELLAVVINSGGGVAVAPPGGFDPVTGTNPIAYGIPTDDGPLVVDMATSKRAWGQVRLANKFGTDLPAETFYNDKGEVTLDPAEALSVMPFGGYKGFSLAFLIEVMCGSLVGMPMMIQSNAGSKFGQKMPERGGLIFVIDPSQTGDLAAFKQANSQFIADIKATRPLAGQTIRIPGEKASSEQVTKVEADSVEIPDDLWADLQKLGT